MSTAKSSIKGADAAMAVLHKLGRIGQRVLRTRLVLRSARADQRRGQLYRDYIDGTIDTHLREQRSGEHD